MATQKQVFTEAKNGIDSANHTTSGIIEYLRYIFGELENATGSGGGSEVSYTQTLATGTETGTIEIDGVSTKMYAPTPAEPKEITVTQVQTTGTKIATISVDNVETDLYAPAGGGGGGSVVIATPDGTTTYAQAFTSAFSLIDASKITGKSYLQSNNGSVFQSIGITNTAYKFSRSSGGSTVVHCDILTIGAGSGYVDVASSGGQDYSNTVNTETYTLYY